MIRLRPLREFSFPIIAECISPAVLEGKTSIEIEGLGVWEGNKLRKLNELFRVEEVAAENPSEDVTIVIHGDVRKVRGIGSHMKSGGLTIEGDVGMHLGAEMKGGKIVVHGNVESWAGSSMSGGRIEVYGSAGDYLAAPYRGSTRGMLGGKITVHGDVGSEAGAWMRKGTIRIRGSSGQFTGFHMCDGAICVDDGCAERAGACMVGGKIVVNGFLKSVLPSFTIDSVKPRVKVEEDETVGGPFYVFVGDMAESGSGKLYVSKEKNSHLSCYERFL